MNFLSNIFSEYFWSQFYHTPSGRRYIEYICEREEGYSEKICFFHFSPLKNTMNARNNLEILEFIKTFYSRAYRNLYPMIKFAIQNDIVISLNSFTEYDFVIKFQNATPDIWKLLERLLKVYGNYDISVDITQMVRFYELYISVSEEFKITTIKTYIECNIENLLPCFQEQYIDGNNIFMVLSIKDENLIKNIKISDRLLIKLKDPIRFSQSQFLLENYGQYLESHFDFNDIYVSFIETNISGELYRDLIYFTRWYSIPA